MKNILIDENFFALNDERSTGLLSGLKKLSAAFDLYISRSKRINKHLLELLKLEGIELKSRRNIEFPLDYIIACGNGSGKNIISVQSRGKIKSFEAAAELIIRFERSARVERKTRETEIDVEVELDGDGKSRIKTGVGFFDHMLDQIARHANINLNVNVTGDLHVDEHHTVEDTGIALGEALRKALGGKHGIKRYGFFLPMDDSTATCALDLGGRSYLNFGCKFSREKVGDFPTELTEEFFRGLSSGLGANLYLRGSGKNDHHKIEAMFKAFAKSLNEACRIDSRAKDSLPSTKGLL
jgi:imidazoleglycerol-phosphate dehydratase / histidinol-phosphatase